MAEDYTTVRLGSFEFEAYRITESPPNRSVGTSANPLAAEPAQTTDFLSGYQELKIDGFLQGLESGGRTPGEDLQRQKRALKAEVKKNSNSLQIAYRGAASVEKWRVFKNPTGPTFVYDEDADSAYIMDVSVTLNCLP